jgi:hypothetical protein
MVRSNHPAQLDELFVPLAGIAKRRDAVAQLTKRELRIALDVEMQIDEAGQHRATAEVDGVGDGRHCDPLGRSGGNDAIPVHDEAARLDGRPATAVDQPHVVEHDWAALHRAHGGAGGNARCNRHQKQTAARLAHRRRL